MEESSCSTCQVYGCGVVAQFRCLSCGGNKIVKFGGEPSAGFGWACGGTDNAGACGRPTYGDTGLTDDLVCRSRVAQIVGVGPPFGGCPVGVGLVLFSAFGCVLAE